MLLFRLELTESCLLCIQSPCYLSRLPLDRYVIRAHKNQTQSRQGNTDGDVQPPIMANHEGCLAIGPLGRAEEAHAKDAADEGGG